jgi:hypothetical protein
MFHADDMLLASIYDLSMQQVKELACELGLSTDGTLGDLRLHIEKINAKTFRTFISVHSLIKSERLSANIKLTLHKALIRFVMTYASPAWEFAADTHLINLQRLQSKVLRIIGSHPRRTPVRELHVAFKILYGYDYITKLCSKQA